MKAKAYDERTVREVLRKIGSALDLYCPHCVEEYHNTVVLLLERMLPPKRKARAKK